jgi:hypothetical protein
MRLKLIVIFCLLSTLQLFSQDNKSQVIQFSGVVVTMDEFGEMVPLPYTTISIQGTNRGTYAETDGFFSVVAEVGDTIVFSRIGFETIKHSVPDTLEDNFYSWYQIMTKDNVLLPEAVIYPWPSKEHYKIEFLALDVSNELRQRAKENLAKEILEQMTMAVPADGGEAYSLAMKQQVQEFKYSGQYKPQNIFNIASWAQFVKAWKRGDFKRKKDKKEAKDKN